MILKVKQRKFQTIKQVSSVMLNLFCRTCGHSELVSESASTKGQMLKQVQHDIALLDD